MKGHRLTHFKNEKSTPTGIQMDYIASEDSLEQPQASVQEPSFLLDSNDKAAGVRGQ
jgi:hypothetical protein